MSETAATIATTQADTWNGGFVFHARTDAVADLDGWEIQIRLTGDITNIWGAEIVDRVGDVYTLRSVSWTGDIAAGQSRGWGFQGTGDAAAFETLSVNGVSVDDAPTPPETPETPPPPRLDVADATALEEDGLARVPVTLSAPADGAVTVDYVVRDADGRVTETAGQITLPAGATSADIEIPLVDDTTDQSDTRFTVEITGVTGAEIGDATAEVTLTDSDLPLPVLSIGDATAAEEDGTATLPLSLSAPAPVAVTATWEVANGAGDIVSTGGTVRIEAGATAAALSVALIDDDLPEATSDLIVRLVSVEGATPGDATATLTLTDGDTAPVPDPGDGSAGSDGDVALPEGLAVTAEVTNSWSTGFNANVILQNVTDARIEGWSITLPDAGFTIQNAWGIDWSVTDDGALVLSGTGWGAALAPGQTTTVGFTAVGTAPDDLLVGGSDPVAPADPEDPTDPAEPTDPGDTPVDPIPSPGSLDAAAYGDALDLSMLFYYAQYSGDLPDDHPIPWRGDSARGDGADVGVDLTGGWYDAGDHVKFGLPMASAATTLAWGGAAFEDGYETAGAMADLVNHIEWVTDYFLRAYDDRGTADLSDDVFYGQVGSGHVDHAYWGAPEDMTMDRPAYAVTADVPGTEVTAGTAAALASASILFAQKGRQDLADSRLDAAVQLYEFSLAYRGTYTDAIPDARSFYNSFSGYQDELAWGAAWLHRATGEDRYLELAENFYLGAATTWAYNWDDAGMGTAVLLAEATGDARYTGDLDRHFDYWMNGIHTLPGTDTNDGLAWLDNWGSNRYAANTAFLALDYADHVAATGDEAYAAELRDFAETQIDYMLGDNPDGFSFVVGFGDDYPLQPHHRAASGTTDVNAPGPNEYTLYGALVGGPKDRSGTYEDRRSDYISNEVAIDYNAGFSSALAGLVEIDGL